MNWIDLEPTIENDVRVFRNRTNHIAGIVLQFMLAGIWALNDPLELRGDWPGGDEFGPVGAAVMALTMGCLAVVASRFGGIRASKPATRCSP
jgi:hypothetical protein